MGDLLRSGGPIMLVLIFLSFVAATIIIERLLYFRKIKGDENVMIKRLKATLEQGNYNEALAICETSPSPVTNLMKVGIEHRHLPINMIKEMIQDAANLEIPRMERFLTSLGTIANISPLLGLLGTVLGNITAFNVLNSLQGVGDPALLAGGIATALVTTAAGIIVSIPAVIFYNYLVNKVNHIIIQLENRVNELVLILGSSGEMKRRDL